MPSVTVIVAAGLAVALGALVQSGLGLGVGLIASPVVTLLDPALMPGSMLVVSASLPLLILVREIRHADWGGASWALGGRVAGTALGVWVVTVVSVRVLGLIVGAVVLVAIVLTSVASFVPRNRWTLLAAGAVSGTTATTTSIGGPPVALLYQRESGPRVRATMSAFFVVGGVIGLTALALAGHLPGRDITTGLLLVAFATVGFAAAPRLRRFLDAGRVRPAVLIVAVISAVILVVHSLLG